MGRTELKIPNQVWATIRQARINQLTDNGRTYKAARIFADMEILCRKRLVHLISPEDAVLADMSWIAGPGDKLIWGLETYVPPVPNDVSSFYFG